MLRHLVQATVRVQQGRDSSAVLPQEVTSTFMAAYQRLLQPCDRAQLLELLASDFGTNSELQAPPQAAERCATYADVQKTGPILLGRCIHSM